MNRKEFVFVLAVTFIVVIVWIGTDVYYRIKKHPEINSDLQNALSEIDTNLDQKTIDTIKSLNQPRSTIAPSIATPNPTPTASASAQVSPTP